MIGQETIDRVRAQTSIAKLIGESVKLERRGRSHVGLCPFHKEKSPSFHVSEERGFYHCFGCAESGDVFKFCQQAMGLSFVEAIRYLAERAGIQIIESEREAPEERERKRKRQELLDVNAAAAKYFEKELLSHPLASYAREELIRRKLDLNGPEATRNALESFRIGYAPYGWEGLSQHLRKFEYNLHSAESVGLVQERKAGPGYYDRFRHRLMFAVVDLNGAVVGFSGRALPDPSPEEIARLGLPPLPPQKPGEAPAKYINSPESLIYRKRDVVFGLYQARQGIRRTENCVLVEGNFDVMSLHARGIDNAVAPLGTAFTVEQARQIRRFCSRVTLLFDGDSAGKRAAQAARETCSEVELEARVAELPSGTDPDDFSRERGAEALGRLIASARGMIEYLIDTTLDGGFAQNDARARAEKIRQVVEILRSEKDPTIRSMAEQHADRIAARLGVHDVRTFRALAAAVRQGLSQPSGRKEMAPASKVVAPPSTARSRDQRAQVELEILGALLDYPELLVSDELEAGVSLLAGDLAVAVAALRQIDTNFERTSVELVLAKLPSSIHPFALARLTAPRHSRLEDARTELVGNMDKLKRLEMARQTNETVEEIERAAKSGDFEQELLLLGEQMRRAKARHGLIER